MGIPSDYVARAGGVHAISSPAGPESGEPFLAVGPRGEVWLSWLEKRASGGHAFKASRLVGSRWAKPIVIAEGDSFFVNWADFPTIVPLGGTRLAAHWPWKSGMDIYAYDVRLSFSADAGRTWGPPVIPHRDHTATEHGFVSMVAEGAGVRAVWLDGRDFAAPAAAAGDSADGGEDEGDHDMSLRSALIRPNGTISDEALLDARVCDCCQTDAVRSGTSVVVAYRDRDPEEVRDHSVVRLESGRWSVPRPLPRDGWKIHGCPVNGPALAAVGERVAAVWFSAVSESAQVKLAFSEDGGSSFGNPQRIDSGAPLGRVDVAMLADGSAMVLWLEKAGSGGSIQLRRVDRKGTVQRPVAIARTSSARASGFPRMVRSGQRLVFAWTDEGNPARVRTALARLK
jgi:hypothetical protein